MLPLNTVLGVGGEEEGKIISLTIPIILAV